MLRPDNRHGAERGQSHVCGRWACCRACPSRRVRIRRNFRPFRAVAIRAAGRAAQGRGDTHAFLPWLLSVCPGYTCKFLGFWCSLKWGKDLFLCYGFVGVFAVGVFHVEHGFFYCKQKSARLTIFYGRSWTKKIAPEGARAKVFFPFLFFSFQGAL